VTTEKAIVRKEKHLDHEEDEDEDEEIIYKIDVPANRYDLLCLEGIARALRIFGQKQSVPTFSCKSSLTHSYQRMVVKPEVGDPFQLF
jgi:phenylalanyl-tRNA synthetase beta chain